ncbi:MAG: YihY family inner membrane protein [Burkholderiales bacterium]|nr:YihY family inner membrane protein [Burkholderiales bacterium]
MEWNLRRLDASLRRAVWAGSLHDAPLWRRTLIRVLRVVLVVLRDLIYGQLTLRAMGLVYTTLVALVPLLAFSFSVLKGFGVHNQLEPMLRQFFQPLGEQAEVAVRTVLGFIENLNVGVLGAVGLAFLLYTAVSLVRKTEESVNYIWHVHRARSFSERFSSYVTVLLVGPVLVFTAIGLTATITGSDQVQQILAVEPVGKLFALGARLAPYLLVIAAFTFAYMFLPSARVRFGSALAGGVVGGVLWQSAGWAFAAFVSGSTRYEAIYASFAVLILFLVWLYVSWLILLLGASVAFYLQNPQYLVPEAGEPRLSNRMRERLAVLLMITIVRRHLNGDPPPTGEDLVQVLGVPAHAVEVVLDALQQGGVLVEVVQPPCSYLPARDPGSVTVGEVLDIVRSTGEDAFLSPGRLPAPEHVERLLREAGTAADEVLGRVSLRELAGESPADMEVEAAGLGHA